MNTTIAAGNLTIAIEGERIARAPAGIDADVVLPDGWHLTPGLIDLQVNGYGDLFPLERPNDVSALDEVMARAGVTSYLVAAPSAPVEQVRALAEALAAGAPAGVAGMHLEGPVLSHAFPGAHPPENLRPGSDPAVLALLDLPNVRFVTVAPEVEGGMEWARAALSRRITVAAGHTAMTYEQALDAIGNGITYATHLFNAMTGIHHRAPGCVGAYLLDPRARFTFIADGVHLSDAVVDLIMRAASERAVLVSDAAPVAGVAERAAPEGVIAGSQATLGDAFARIARGYGVHRAISAACAMPASVLGDGARGALAPGARADLAIWNEDFACMTTIRAGELIWRAPEMARAF